MSKRRSLMTPNATTATKGRKSMLGFTSAHAKSRGELPEARKLSFCSARKGVGNSSNASMSVPMSASRMSTSSRWSMGGSQLKDSRPLTSKAYQKLMVQEIIEFLNESGYPHMINVKILSAPTTKEFLRVFEHLYNFLLPNFSLDPKKYADEIPILMKNLHFPFQISKTVMRGMGSLHAWPTLLGVLHWLAELIRTISTIDVEQMLYPPALLEDFKSVHKQLFLDHSARTYVQFMLGQEDFSEENKILENAAMRLVGCLSNEESDALELEVSNLEAELAELEDEPDILAEALKQKADMEELITNSKQSINEIDAKNSCLQIQHDQYSAQVKEETEGYIIQLGDARRQAELKRKSSEIELQLNRLNAEKDRLEQLNDEREVRFSKLYDKFSAAATEYNDIAMKLSTNSHVQNCLDGKSIFLNFAHSRDDLDHFKVSLKPLLVNLSHQISEDRFKLEARKIEEELKLDKMKETVSTKRNFELVSLKNDLAKIEKEAVVDKEVERKYSTCIEDLKNADCLIDEKQKDSIDMLKKEKIKLTSKKKECDELYEKQLKEQNAKFQSVLQFGNKIMEHKKLVENKINEFNGYLRGAVKTMKDDAKQVTLLAEI